MNEETVFQKIINGEDLEGVKNLLTTKDKINQPNTAGQTPLYLVWLIARSQRPNDKPKRVTFYFPLMTFLLNKSDTNTKTVPSLKENADESDIFLYNEETADFKDEIAAAFTVLTKGELVWSTDEKPDWLSEFKSWSSLKTSSTSWFGGKKKSKKSKSKRNKSKRNKSKRNKKLTK